MKLIFPIIGCIGTGYGLHICMAGIADNSRLVDVILIIFSAVGFLLLLLFSLFMFFVILLEAKAVDSRGGRLNITYYVLPDAQLPINVDAKEYGVYLPKPEPPGGPYRARMLVFSSWRLVLITKRTKISGDKDALPFLENE